MQNKNLELDKTTYFFKQCEDNACQAVFHNYSILHYDDWLANLKTVFLIILVIWESMTLPIQHVVFFLKSAVTVAHTEHHSIKTQQVLSKHPVSSPNSLPSRKCNNLTFTQNTATSYQLITLASNDTSVATTQIILATHKQPSRTVQRLENTAHPANNLEQPSKTQATTIKHTIANT